MPGEVRLNATPASLPAPPVELQAPAGAVRPGEAVEASSDARGGGQEGRGRGQHDLATAQSLVDEAVLRIRQKLADAARLSIALDPGSGRVQVRDAQGRLLGELPPERVVEAARLMDQVVGLLLDAFW
ncbi:MAG: flagellar protein FlaG [Firmicutes bacterium]|nr:flagellar protein FlaG [Bacillota bacterium]